MEFLKSTLRKAYIRLSKGRWGHSPLTRGFFAVQERHLPHHGDLGLLQPVLGAAFGRFHQLSHLGRGTRGTGTLRTAPGPHFGSGCSGTVPLGTSSLPKFAPVFPPPGAMRRRRMQVAEEGGCSSISGASAGTQQQARAKRGRAAKAERTEGTEARAHPSPPRRQAFTCQRAKGGAALGFRASNRSVFQPQMTPASLSQPKLAIKRRAGWSGAGKGFALSFYASQESPSPPDFHPVSRGEKKPSQIHLSCG